MGLASTLRSMEAAGRRMERNARRRQRELERIRKEDAKLLEQELAQLEVEEYENTIEQIQTIHIECSETIQWKDVRDQKKPEKPENNKENEIIATSELKNFQPGFFHKIFNLSEKKIKKLENEINISKLKDEEIFQNKLMQYEYDIKNWKEETDLAHGVLGNTPNFIVKALEKYGGFSELSDLGSNLHFTMEEDGILRIDLYTHGEDILPTEECRLLKSGKLSKKEMSKSKYNELYQDYVCSAVLRVAREVFATVPIEEVEITALNESLNSSTGHLEDTPVLSVLAVRSTLEKLNLDEIDPSDSMKNFAHLMNFKKTTGFEPVERLNWTGPSSN